MTGYSISNSVTFTVTIYDSCSNAVLTMSSITSPHTYSIESGSAMSLGTLSWTRSLTYCPSITYSIVTSTGTTADTIFYITGSIIYVNTALSSKTGTYNLQIKG
jgi:hypothetical protein